MLGSNSNFFFQDISTLEYYRIRLEEFLEYSNRSEIMRKAYLNAYDFFVENPSKYDGATATQDLTPKWLPFDWKAMLHDYLYICLNAKSSPKYIKMADSIYLNEIKYDGHFGVYLWWQKTRLSVVAKPYAVYNRFSNSMEEWQKNKICKIYNAL